MKAKFKVTTNAGRLICYADDRESAEYVALKGLSRVVWIYFECKYIVHRCY